MDSLQIVITIKCHQYRDVAPRLEKLLRQYPVAPPESNNCFFFLRVVKNYFGGIYSNIHGYDTRIARVAIDKNTFSTAPRKNNEHASYFMSIDATDNSDDPTHVHEYPPGRILQWRDGRGSLCV